MIKRISILFLALVVCAGALPAAAEETVSNLFVTVEEDSAITAEDIEILTDEEAAELAEAAAAESALLDVILEETAPAVETEVVVTTVSQGLMPVIHYVGIAQTNLSIRVEQDKEADAVGYIRKGDKVWITGYDPAWLTVVKGEDGNWVQGYVIRHGVSEISTRLEGILPYGTTPAAYSAVITGETKLMDAPSTDATMLKSLKEGSKMAILSIEDGWAKVIYWRQYAYFYLDSVKDLTPVYDLQTAQSGDTLAAFISFYRVDDTDLNNNRMHNIWQACEYISIPMEPGQEFSFNNTAGPYRSTRGYLKGISYLNGRTELSYGGGTCQVSSTLYNVLLALDGGITVVYRRAHGPSGATYLPHGVDAAVGNDSLDLVFRNDFGFTIRLEACAVEGVLYIAILKA